MAKIPAEAKGSAVKSTSKLPSMEAKFFKRMANIFMSIPSILTHYHSNPSAGTPPETIQPSRWAYPFDTSFRKSPSISATDPSPPVLLPPPSLRKLKRTLSGKTKQSAPIAPACLSPTPPPHSETSAQAQPVTPLFPDTEPATPLHAEAENSITPAPPREKQPHRTALSTQTPTHGKATS